MANAPLQQPLLHGKIILVKADLGTKRACPSCAARFYDLTKRPIECPKCGFSYEPEALFKQRRSRVAEPAAAGVVAAQGAGNAEEEEEDEDEEAEEEEAEAESGMSVVEADEADVIEDIEVEDDEDEEDNDLLGEVEDEEDDVSGIIDPGISKDES